MKNVKIYDNGGETVDRFTIVIGCDIVCMSNNPLSPQGVNTHMGSYGHLADRSKWGEEVPFVKLSKDLKEAIRLRKILYL